MHSLKGHLHDLLDGDPSSVRLHDVTRHLQLLVVLRLLIVLLVRSLLRLHLMVRLALLRLRMLLLLGMVLRVHLLLLLLLKGHLLLLRLLSGGGLLLLRSLLLELSLLLGAGHLGLHLLPEIDADLVRTVARLPHAIDPRNQGRMGVGEIGVQNVDVLHRGGSDRGDWPNSD